MTQAELDEMRDVHLPHRINLLIAFRERFSGRNSAKQLNAEDYRDLFRCAKDISMMMVRFFCREVGIRLKQGANMTDQIPPEGGTYAARQVLIGSLEST